METVGIKNHIKSYHSASNGIVEMLLGTVMLLIYFFDNAFDNNLCFDKSQACNWNKRLHKTEQKLLFTQQVSNVAVKQCLISSWNFKKGKNLKRVEYSQIFEIGNEIMISCRTKTS